MRLPAARGPITAGLFARLGGRPVELDPPLVTPPPGTALDDGDLQLALFACYELHARGFDDVDDLWEWQPSLLATRRDLERSLESALAHAVPRPPAVPPSRVRDALAELVAKEETSVLSPAHLQREADLGRFRELLVHRSIHHLKDTSTRVRLSGDPSAERDAGAEQAGVHLFRATMTGIGLDDSYGAYLPVVPGITLAVSNVRTLFGLHRRLRGALAGHLAASEPATSPAHLAALGLCAELAAREPSLTGDILYGAACALALERRWAEHVVNRWRLGLSSLDGDPDEVGREPVRHGDQEGEAVAATG
ncbi:iron-containing redox enzyme family protein [Nonomuraea sp. PA05]|uniref:iron-containing redox enzyme family protein n=1 Tax=Nonomuraea sp. PA05 TaxID=2604466 RepID=UPI0011DA7915|nr:iron-containing redox enzyme family protein [Nonomuraea sp. PA05]TYB56559.1 iron-containing redox enzyme family protein [Nonomuraea sp. PA05]